MGNVRQRLDDAGFGSLPWLSEGFKDGDIGELTANTCVESLGLLIQREDNIGLLSESHKACIRFLDPALRKRELGSRSAGDGTTPIFRHRVIDLCLWKEQSSLGVSPTKAIFPQRPTYAEVVSDGGLRAESHLADWTKLIQQASDMFDEHDRGEKLEPPSNEESSCSSSPPPLGSVAPVQDDVLQFLFSAMCTRFSRISLFYILANFERAAFYLRYLLKVDMDFPDTLTELEARLGCSENIYWKLFKQNEKPTIANLKICLYLLLSISPILLLLPLKLEGKCPARAKLAQAMIELGRDRPDFVARVEVRLLQVVFNVANGQEALYPSLAKAIRECTSMLNQATELDQKWFTTDATLFCIPSVGTTTPIARPRSNQQTTTSSPSNDVLTPQLPKRKSQAPERYGFSNSTGSTSQKTTRPPRKRQKRPPGAPASSPPGTSSAPAAVASSSSQALPPEQLPHANRQTHRVGRPSQQASQGSHTFSGIYDLTEDYNCSFVFADDEGNFQKSMYALSWVTSAKVSMINPGTQEVKTLEPQFHFSRDVDWFASMHDAAQRAYVDGYPHYLICEPEEGRTTIFTQEAYSKTLLPDLMRVLKRSNLYVYPLTVPNVTFDLVTLFHAVSGGVQEGCRILNFAVYDRRKQDTVGLVVEFITSKNQGGPALLCPGLTTYFDVGPVDPFSTDAFVFAKVVGLPFCGPTETYPFAETRKVMVSSGGCYQPWHLDTDGFGLVFEILVGYVIIYYATPLDPARDPEMANTNLYDRTFDCWEPNGHRFNTETVLLSPGSNFVLQPGTLFSLVFPVPSIVKVRRFYARPSMPRTLYTLMHTTVGNVADRPCRGQASFMLLNRIITLWHICIVEGQPMIVYPDTFRAHVPSTKTWDGLIEIMSLCNIFALGNVLKGWRYGPPFQLTRERHILINGRRDGTNPSHSFKKDVYWPYLVDNAYAMYYVCKHRWLCGLPARNQYPWAVDGLLGCWHPDDLLAAIRRCFHDDEGPLEEMFNDKIRTSPDISSYAFCAPDYDIEVKEDIVDIGDPSGLTEDDKLHGVLEASTDITAMAHCKRNEGLNVRPRASSI